MKELQIQNVRGYLDKDGTAYLNLEDISRGLGFTTVAKSGNVTVRWSRVNEYLVDLGFLQEVAKDDVPEFIPENIFYRLAMKAKNTTAESFQAKVADEILPSIRKHGTYLTDEKIEEVLLNPDTIIQLATQLKKEREEKTLLAEQVKNDKPKVLFAEAVENSEDVILVKEMALILTQQDFKVGQNQLFEYLRMYGYLCKKTGDMYNLPTKKYEHLFKVTKRTIQHTNKTSVRNTPKITGKGQIYFIKKFAEYKLKGLTIEDLLMEDAVAN